MWRICRKTIFPRWNATRPNPVDNKNQNTSQSPKALVICPASEKKRYSHHEEKQHAHKRCWDDPHFEFNNCYSTLLETAGWVGTAAALCINIHWKQLKKVLDHDGRPPSACLFSRSVLAMPKSPTSSRDDRNPLTTALPIGSSPVEGSTQKDKVSTDTDILTTIQNISEEYAAAVQNSAGIASLQKNDRKAFRSFQAAARLGSSQAFYNLGLCYELGKGTRVNLQRAAFCYGRAAVRGHGLASFNLGVYFTKGMGGLPVDTQTARILFQEAARKGVVEAQLYLAIEFLEEDRWLEAVEMFRSLEKENVPEGQYYLGLCFENGWGVERNERTAVQLFSKSSAQGNQKATVKLRNFSQERKRGSNGTPDFSWTLFQILMTRNNIHTEQTKSDAVDTSRNNRILHVSASVPELAASVKTSPQKSLVSSYSNLVLPFFSIQNTLYRPKSSFSIGEDVIVSNPLIGLSQAVQLKT